MNVLEAVAKAIHKVHSAIIPKVMILSGFVARKVRGSKGDG
jgi:hypothetical protein